MLTLEKNCENIVNTIEENSPANEEQSDRPEHGKAERIISPLIFILSFLFIRFVIFNVTGIISSLIYIALITLSIMYMKHKNYVFSGFNKALAVVLYMFSLVFSITDNSFIKFLDGVFLFGAGAYFVFSVCAERKDIDRYLPFAMKDSIFRCPFAEFKAQSEILSDTVKDSDTGTNIKRTLLGLLLAVPVTVIVASLLMSADSGMEKMLSGIFEEFLSHDIWTWIVQLCIAVPCSFYLFGMLYSNVYRRKISDLTDAECDGKLRSKRVLNNLVFYSGATPVLLLYVMFFISQASYFLSAFMGRLPEGFSYAEYARKGFFELCWIVVINLFIMMIMNLHSTHSGEEKTAALKIYNVIFCIFTLILIATSLSKMVMYIDAYGLTVMRVYTTWFMVLCTFIFITVLVKQFKADMHMSKVIAVGFTVMFAVLCFSRAESLIVKYNHNTGKVTMANVSDSGITFMSDDGVLTAVKEGLLTSEEGYDINEFKHRSHMTDNLNISTLLLEDIYYSN